MLINKLNEIRKEKLQLKLPKKSLYGDITHVLQSGDIVLFRGNYQSFYSHLIMNFTNSPYTHATIYDSKGYIISADAFGIQYNDMIFHYTADVFRLKNITQDKQQKIVKEARKMLGNSYSYKGGFGFPWINKNYAKKLVQDKSNNCSEMVSLTYKNCGIDLVEGLIESVEAPADISWSPKLNYLGTFKNGNYITDKAYDLWLPEQYKIPKSKWLSFVLTELLSKLVMLTSEIDERYKNHKRINKLYKGD